MFEHSGERHLTSDTVLGMRDHSNFETILSEKCLSAPGWENIPQGQRTKDLVSLETQHLFPGMTGTLGVK